MIKRIVLAVVILVLFASTAIPVYAEERELPDEYGELLDELPEDIKNLLPEEIFSNDYTDIHNGAAKITKWEYIIDLVFDIVGLNLKEIAKALALICSSLMISALINAFTSTLRNNVSSYVLKLIAGIILAVTLIEVVKVPIERTSILLGNITTFVNIVSPLICTMYAMGGNVSSALINNYGMIVFLAIFENVCVLAIEMILGICMALTLASVFVDDGRILAMSSAIKKAFTFAVGFIMLVFTTVISAQGILAIKADTLSAKAAKMLASQMIPVVGSTVGESLRTAGASIEYLRSSVGVTLIIIFSIMILPTVISMFLYRTALIISNAVAGLLNCSKEGSVLNEVSSIHGYALGILLITSIALLLLMTVFVKTASPLS